VKSNLKVLAMAVAMAAAAGCAHGPVAPERASDARGMARVGQQARALLVGPARLVHATGDKPVRWFVADRVSGDDRDCAGLPSPVALGESAGAQLAVGSGQVLCAAVARGATDVMWHRLPDVADTLWARR
jgi:hypothetical protein